MHTREAHRTQAVTRRVDARAAAHLAIFIRRALAAGLNGLDLIEAVDTRFPGITLRTFAGAFALYHAFAGHPEFELSFPHRACPGAQERCGSSKQRRERKLTMNMTKYAGAAFIKFEDVAQGPQRQTIADVRMGGYDRPVLEFESEHSLSINATNTRTLIKSYGEDSRDWIGLTIELYAGQIEFKGEKTNSVLVRPVSPGKPLKEWHAAERPAARAELDDEIPF
jgi:hypothetical protein